MKAEALKGHLDLLLRAAVAVRPADGCASVEALRTLSGGTFDLPEGTVYPALHRPEQAGWLKSHWVEATESETGRRRRLYALSPEGRRTLEDGRDQWARFADAVTAVLGRRPRAEPT